MFIELELSFCGWLYCHKMLYMKTFSIFPGRKFLQLRTSKKNTCEEILEEELLVETKWVRYLFQTHKKIPFWKLTQRISHNKNTFCLNTWDTIIIQDSKHEKIFPFGNSRNPISYNRNMFYCFTIIQDKINY